MVSTLCFRLPLSFQNKEQNRDTRNAADEPLNDETLKKILDALFDKKSTGGFSSQEKSDMDSSASENVDTLVNKDLSSVVKRSDVVYPVFEVDYQVSKICRHSG